MYNNISHLGMSRRNQGQGLGKIVIVVISVLAFSVIASTIFCPVFAEEKTLTGENSVGSNQNSIESEKHLQLDKSQPKESETVEYGKNLITSGPNISEGGTFEKLGEAEGCQNYLRAHLPPKGIIMWWTSTAVAPGAVYVANASTWSESSSEKVNLQLFICRHGKSPFQGERTKISPAPSKPKKYAVTGVFDYPHDAIRIQIQNVGNDNAIFLVAEPAITMIPSRAGPWEDEDF